MAESNRYDDPAKRDAMRARFAEFVGEPATEELDDYLAEAAELINAAARGYIDEIPGPALQRADLEVAADLWHRRQSRAGVVGLDMDGTVVRINRDPMAAAWPILRRWIPQGIA